MLRCCKHGARGQHRQIEQKDSWLSRQDDGSAQELARVATVPRRAREITKSETHAPVNIGCSTSANTYSSAYVTCQPALIIPITHASTHEVHTTVLLNIDHKRKEDARHFHNKAHARYFTRCVCYFDRACPAFFFGFHMTARRNQVGRFAFPLCLDALWTESACMYVCVLSHFYNYLSTPTTYTKPALPVHPEGDTSCLVAKLRDASNTRRCTTSLFQANRPVAVPSVLDPKSTPHAAKY